MSEVAIGTVEVVIFPSLLVPAMLMPGTFFLEFNCREIAELLVGFDPVAKPGHIGSFTRITVFIITTLSRELLVYFSILKRSRQES